jgi:hypothetical protein
MSSVNILLLLLSFTIIIVFVLSVGSINRKDKNQLSNFFEALVVVRDLKKILEDKSVEVTNDYFKATLNTAMQIMTNVSIENVYERDVEQFIIIVKQLTVLAKERDLDIEKAMSYT